MSKKHAYGSSLGFVIALVVIVIAVLAATISYVSEAEAVRDERPVRIKSLQWEKFREEHLV